MARMKDLPTQVAVLVDVVSSRRGDRGAQHRAILSAIDAVNDAVPAVDPLHPTVGDEFQGVYPTLGAALAAVFRLRLIVAPHIELRAGIGGGEVAVIDAERGIQDGSAWWLAREAIDAVEHLATRAGYRSARIGVRDSRQAATPHVEAMSLLVDSAIHRLRPGVTDSLLGLVDGTDNAEVARRQGITASANSQRIAGNDLRILADALRALSDLP